MNKRFTLIELIITIVVIGILASIVLIAVKNFREEAEVAALKGNVKELQTASELYYLQNKEQLASISKLSKGNPSKIDYKKLNLKKELKETKSKGFYWIDINGTVWGSFIDLPTGLILNTDEKTVSFKTNKKASYCYIVLYDSQYKILERKEVKVNNQENIKTSFTTNKEIFDFGVNCADKYENETAEVSLNKEGRTNIFKNTEEYKTVDDSLVVITELNLVNGIFAIGEPLVSKIKVQNITNETKSYAFGYTFEDKNGNTFDADMIYETFAPNETKEVTLSWTSKPNQNIEGHYSTYFAMRKGESLSERVIFLKEANNVFLYDVLDEWVYFEQDDWVKLDGRTISQISTLVESTVSLNNREIDISLPQDSYLSGQTRSIDTYSYGSYETKMKVPNSDSLLNGFFLYTSPDREYEIDIEILKRNNKWYAWFTIHNENNPEYNPHSGLEPGELFKKEVELTFDPSADFHSYRINLYKDYVSFIVDGKEYARYNGEFDYKEMNVFTSSFYPHWLTRGQHSETKKLEVEWVRRGFFTK